MRKIAVILSVIILFSANAKAQHQYKNYDELWKKVQKFEESNLPKSALIEVEKIYATAKKENNAPQLLKTLLFKSKYALILEEGAQLNIINSFKKEISTTDFPTKNMLESTLANLYWQYYQQNRWKFYNRTTTETKLDSADFRTWDLQTIFAEIHFHFQKSLENEMLAQKTDLNGFNDILELQKDSKIFRPTLFDFLSHNALEFYKSTETSITNPVYKFEISEEKYLANFEEFSNIKLETKDSLSLQFQALKIYQKLAAFHQKENNSNAFIAVELERLEFVRQNATFGEKETLFLNSLINLKNEFKIAESSTLIDFEIASVYNNQANDYVPLSKTENQFKRVKALEICEEAIAKFPKSFGAQKCNLLKQQILNLSLNIVAEKYVPNLKDNKVLVSYKNVPELYFHIFKINEKEKGEFARTYNDSAKIAFIKKLELLTSFRQSLKTENDYQQHSTEILIPPFSNGNYLIYASTFETLNPNSLYATAIIQATDIAVVENNQNNSNNYQIVDRNSGKPLIGAKVNIKNYDTGKYNNPINENFITDNKGQINFTAKSHYNNVVLTVNYNKEIATFGDYYLNENSTPSRETENTTINSFLFTDRSIYRPGQTVYYKGIVLKSLKNKSEIVVNEFVEVTLYNVNEEIVKSVELKTNDYGSFSGEFILPTNGLTGRYSIEVEEGSKDSALYDLIDSFNNSRTEILVEEYKRPKFEAEFKPITETYKLNDSITVNGSAVAFAGSTITDAKVAYRVHRKVQYPKWFYWYRPIFPATQAQEIVHGETITDAQGNFNITFKAIPDKSVDAANLPIFIYEVTAEIIDINGETRSATTEIKVGYHSLIAEIQMASEIDKNKKENIITVVTKNLNNELVSAKGNLKIYKLQAPKNVLRARPWNAPDYQEISEEIFRNKFPNEAYTNENEIKNWPKGALVFEENFDTSKITKIQLKKIQKWLSGNYVVELETTDKYGQKVTDKQLFIVFSETENQVADNQLLVISANKQSYKPFENVVLKVGSASKNLFVTIDIEKDHKIIDTQIIHLENNAKFIQIPVTVKDLGGFAVHYSFSNFNAFKSGTLPIPVPYEKKELEIETVTFRDKLQPGESQTWSFKVKGEKGDKVAAELLASMYDASLDEFKPHNWEFNPITQPLYYSLNNRNANNSFGNSHFNVVNIPPFYDNYAPQQFDRLNWFGLHFNNSYRIRGMNAEKMMQKENLEVEAVGIQEDAIADVNELQEVVTVGYGKEKEPKKEENLEKLDPSSVKIRKNFQETAFFYPHLSTDKEGNISFNFTIPEALTRWKLQLLAHTKELAVATKTLTTITQKELMVLPNPPRFLREGDTIVFSSKISNLTENILNGIAVLELTDAITGKQINELLGNSSASQNFKVDAKGNTQISWKLQIPEDIQAVQYKIIAKAGDFSDGEQNVLPVLSNRMLVTETLSMWVRSNQTKTFTLDKLKNNASTTLKNHKLTLEITSNPAWYAVQSLPYLMEYPYDCSEQTFSRYYANSLASHIINSNPRIQEVFNQWKSSDALISNLEKNEELKSIIIQETPWLRDAQSETEQKKRIALLFDLNKMKNDQQAAINKLKEQQFSNGGFPWFKGSDYPNRYITQHIATGFGHLQKLGVKFSGMEAADKSAQNIISKAVNFLDEEILDDYNKLLAEAKKLRDKEKSKEKGLKAETDYLAKNHLGHIQLHYLYMRSFYGDLKIASKVQTAIDYYTKQSASYWKEFNLYSKGMIALVQHRTQNKSATSAILKSMHENSIVSEELGMYWKENTASWFWHQAPIETQALLIEAFSEIENNTATVDELKVWLLKNKQTNSWKTTKATTKAIYALLLQGSDWLAINESVEVTVGNQKIEPSTLENVKIEAGTGYFKTSWNGNEITPEMGEVTISKKDKGIAWGGLYWQYFEDLDKITSAETPLKLTKNLFLKTNSDKGKLLTEITQNIPLKVGDLITVRIELKVDRPMEFVHMKDMRASGLEPINVLSAYKWQDGLGYYESTKDASTNFFFENLPKGVYVFEYDLRVNNAGNFSNGITTIQSMYAPEFSSHSEGVRVDVSN
ncbi:MAG: alpha-2-macroglobulin [Flavobacteria bacterium RIFCSPLOWO2_12_FULL_35_11]|nr:MAG: alpha-2-macroglobulin [Flavobacteria bacterium RIFCSPLOWO2_12_FULL_35_11]